MGIMALIFAAIACLYASVGFGGGSSYTPELIEGYIKRKDEMPIDEIVLVDIEAGQEKLNIVGEMANRMVKAAGRLP